MALLLPFPHRRSTRARPSVMIKRLFIAFCLFGAAVSGFTSFFTPPRISFQPQVRFSPSILVLGFQQPPPEAEAFLDDKEEEEEEEEEEKQYEVEHMSLFLVNRLGRVLVRRISQEEPVDITHATVSTENLAEKAGIETPKKNETEDTAREDPELATALPTDDVDAEPVVAVASNDEEATAMPTSDADDKPVVEVASNDELGTALPADDADAKPVLAVASNDEAEIGTTLHKREGDRNLGLKDEFILPEEEQAQEDGLLEKEEEEATVATTEFLDLMAERKAKNAAASAASLYIFPLVISKEFGRPLPIIRDGIPPVTKTPLVELKSADEEAALKSLESAKELLTNATKTSQDVQAAITSARAAPAETVEAKETPQVAVDQGTTDMAETEAPSEDMGESESDIVGEVPMAENVIESKRVDAGLGNGQLAASTNETRSGKTELPAHALNQTAEATLATEEVLPLQQVTTRPNPSPVDAKRNISEEAYSTLTNLGLIQKSPNPKDPDYNHSADNEFAQENQILD